MSVMNDYVCIHGHFYQPPRENPWLEEVELQPETHPYHDWNEKINAECYSQNAASRILASDGRIEKIVNNYERISFNFGPTLLSWLERNDSQTYQAILEADKKSRYHFSGHGSAIAQGYNHVILPLATADDKETQVAWGIRDFETRFRRQPEGMWLPETAVDTETLEVLAQAGILFTILSPYQAKRVRKIGSDTWSGTVRGNIYTTRAYKCNLPSGRSISLFFYDGQTSQAVAFEKLLSDGAFFAKRILAPLDNSGRAPRLSHIATDGESYGHHHRFGDMALAFALDHIFKNNLARITNYGEFLALFPPDHEVEIVEDSSWSCLHGVKRWTGDCGCNTGAHPQWNQEWRTHLRESLDWLRDRADRLFDELGGVLFRDARQARNDYITVILDRSDENVDKFLDEHRQDATQESLDSRLPRLPLESQASDMDVLRLRLLEMQRQRMLMYTSCGWFFDDLAEIQTVQVIQYAARVLEIVQCTTGEDITGEFVARLEKAKCNDAADGDGGTLFREQVLPVSFNPAKAGTQYAIRSLFEELPEKHRIYSYEIQREHGKTLISGKASLSMGFATMKSQITRESACVGYAALHLGDHNIAGGVRECDKTEDFEESSRVIENMYRAGDITGIIRFFDEKFGANTFSLQTLLADERRKILNIILTETVEKADAEYKTIYEQNVNVMRFLDGLKVDVPRALIVAAERALNHQLEHAFNIFFGDGKAHIFLGCLAAPKRRALFNISEIKRLLSEADERTITFDNISLQHVFQKNLEALAVTFHELCHNNRDHQSSTLEMSIEDSSAMLTNLADAIELTQKLPFRIDLWKIQNIYFDLAESNLSGVCRENALNEQFLSWQTAFARLGELLGVAMPGQPGKIT